MTEFCFESVRNQKFSKYKSASFIMDFLAIGDTCLFVSLSGLGSTFYGMTRINIRRLQKFRRVNDSLNITCRNEDDIKVKIEGSFCWKIYNEEFEGLAPISISQKSAALVCESKQLSVVKLNRTLRELHSHYETFLFIVKNHELKIMEDTYEPHRGKVNVESGGKCNGQSSSNRYMNLDQQQQIRSDSRTAMALQIGTFTKGSPDDNRVKKARQLIKIIDLASKITKTDELIRLLCPFCSKPVLCSSSCPSSELLKTALGEPDVPRNPSSWSNIDLLRL